MLINGQSGECIAAADRGLNYGDGLFETLAVTEGAPCLWTAHMARLVAGCRRLGIAPPEPGRLWNEALREIGEERRGVLKIVVTRGIGGRGYRPPAQGEPTRILTHSPWPDHPTHWKEARLRICRTRLGINPALAGLKHLNRLEQVLARAEWDDPGIAEGLMLDSADRVVEGTMTNLFVVHNGRLATPALHRCGVAGVMRALVMEVAGEQDLAVEERDLELDDLMHADALFLTNSLIGLRPVRQLADRHFDPSAVPAALVREVDARAFSGLDTGGQ